MTILELAERDFRKAENTLMKAIVRPGISHDELNHIRELFELRIKILELVKANEIYCPLGGDPVACEECIYGIDYHYVDGRCERRTCNEQEPS